jgi:DNA-binding LacI/PurR family transcriptional regulator
VMATAPGTSDAKLESVRQDLGGRRLLRSSLPIHVQFRPRRAQVRCGGGDLLPAGRSAWSLDPLGLRHVPGRDVLGDVAISREDPASSEHRRPRLVDVAAAVGLHISTVSRVLNGDTNLSIRPETRDRILTVAQRQGYRPNAMARALKRSRTGALAMIVPLLRNPIWSGIQRGALQRAVDRGQVVMILEEPEESVRPPTDYQYLVEESRADGLLIATALRSGGARSPVPSVPHVYMNRRGPRPGNNVVMDEEKAMRLFVEHLAALGHRRLAIVDGFKVVDTVYRRAAAVRALCKAHGLSVTFQHIEHSEAGGYEATRRLMARTDVPTAIGVGNLNQLFGATMALREVGAGVPEDVSLISFDEDHCLGYLEVPITSVSMPLEELGAAAVLALIERVDGGGGEDVLVSDPLALIRRESTAEPRSSRRLRR